MPNNFSITGFNAPNSAETVADNSMPAKDFYSTNIANPSVTTDINNINPPSTNYSYNSTGSQDFYSTNVANPTVTTGYNAPTTNYSLPTADAAADNSMPAQNYFNSKLTSTNDVSDLKSNDSTPTPNSSQPQFDTNGNSTGSSSKPNMNKDTAALTQVGVYSNPGFFGDQSMKNSDAAFGKAINLCSAVAGFASTLQKKTAPPNYVRLPTSSSNTSSYFLTDIEKNAIDKKSKELASYGVVPFDVLQKFFYVLAAIENPSDMVHISQVVGIPELEDQNYIRNIRGILALSDIYKVAYLANALSSIINTYSSLYLSSQSAANPYNTSFGNVQRSSDLAMSLGVLGPVILSAASNLNGNIGVLSNAPNLSSSSISNAIASAIQLASGSSIGLGATALTNPSGNISQIATQIGVGAVKNLLSSSPLGGVLSQFGALGGVAAGPLLQQTGGLAIGNFMSELITGTRIPTQKIANNPTLRPPSYAGKAFFGETPCALPAVDQLFCRKVGSFGNPTGGTGADSFGMQNFASFGGAMDIGSVVSKMVTGSSSIPDTSTYFGKSMQTMIGNVCNILNVKTNASIEMRRSDNAIPFVIGMSAAISGESFSPFGSKPISDGWKLASSAANDIQRYNPQFLQTCKTSL